MRLRGSTLVTHSMLQMAPNIYVATWRHSWRTFWRVKDTHSESNGNKRIGCLLRDGEVVVNDVGLA